MTGSERAVDAAAAAALELVGEGATVGLGTGRAAARFITLLGDRVRRGFPVSGVATSSDSAGLAAAAGIPLIDLSEELELDLTVDGADEVAPNLDLIKGWGGALVRERIVAAASRRQVIIVASEKLVAHLGERGRIPVEIIPLARGPALRALKAQGLEPEVRAAPDGAGPYRTENDNLILDCAPDPSPLTPEDARSLDRAIRRIPGVVDTGFFLGTAERVLVGHPDGRVDLMLRSDGGGG
ncbi:MAG TPA: ribose-5-phosphate isomerase RpiA [Gemmatimonadales bacterium]|nr:ribose-5-phosphate isomerase RpiA [Gemmatimonadales bacterium]